MKKNVQVLGIAVFGFSFMTLLPIAAQADVTIKRVTHFNEVTGITAHDSTTTDYIQGNKKREENLRKFTGAVLGAWQRFRHEDKGSLSVDIELIGENKHYELDPNEKTYSVEPLYEPSQSGQEDDAKGNAQDQRQQEQDNDTKVTKNEFTVKATGQKKNINGFDTVEYLVTWDVETENTKTGEKGKSLMTADLWNSMDSRLAKAHQEEAAYDYAYRKLMKLPASDDESQQFGFGTVRMTSTDRKMFFDKLHTIKGYSVSTDVKWEAASADKNGKSENEDEHKEQSGGSLDSALGGLFGSKSNNDDNRKQSTNGMTMIFSSHVEIKSVNTDKLSKSLFEVPKDYKTD